jgi:hypothetical protein
MSDKKEFDQMVLTNTRVRYAKVIRPGKAFDEGNPDEWSVNMYLTDEDREALMARGINPKEDKDGNEYWTAKRSTVTSNKAEAKPPVVVTAAKAPWGGDDIGNGSVCNVAVTLIPWEKAKRKGIKLYLNAIQVVNHVPYTPAGNDVFGIIDGSATNDDVFN